jgi:hypothetical protein
LKVDPSRLRQQPLRRLLLRNVDGYELTEALSDPHRDACTRPELWLGLRPSRRAGTAVEARRASKVFGGTFNVAATASSGLDVAITTTGGCSGGGTGSVTITMTSGTTDCVVHYNQAGTATATPLPR